MGPVIEVHFEKADGYTYTFLLACGKDKLRGEVVEVRENVHGN